MPLDTRLQRNNMVTLLIMDSRKRSIIKGRALFLDTDSTLGKGALSFRGQTMAEQMGSLVELVAEKVFTYKC